MANQESKRERASGAERTVFTLTTAAKAREIGKSEQTVRQLADSGKLAHIRDSNRNRLFRPER